MFAKFCAPEHHPAAGRAVQKRAGRELVYLTRNQERSRDFPAFTPLEWNLLYFMIGSFLFSLKFATRLLHFPVAAPAGCWAQPTSESHRHRCHRACLDITQGLLESNHFIDTRRCSLSSQLLQPCRDRQKDYQPKLGEINTVLDYLIEFIGELPSMGTRAGCQGLENHEGCTSKYKYFVLCREFNSGSWLSVI